MTLERDAKIRESKEKEEVIEKLEEDAKRKDKRWRDSQVQDKAHSDKIADLQQRLGECEKALQDIDSEKKRNLF